MGILAIASGKGGTGKSCIAAYTGTQLALSGKKVLLIELGASSRSLDLILGMQDNVVFDSADILSGRCDPERAILSTPYEMLSLVPGPAAAQTACPFGAADVETLLAGLQSSYNHILLDGVDFSTVPLPMLQSVWMVTTPDSLCVRASALLAQELHNKGAKKLRLVVNNVPAQVPPMYGARDFDDIIDQIGVQLIGVIPSSPKLQYSANNGEALDPASLTVRVFANMAARLEGERRPLLIR